METINIPVEDSKWGCYNIYVPNTNLPQWFGQYQTGNLAIYQGIIKDNIEDIPGYALVYVISNQDMEETNMIGYGIYINSCSFQTAVNLLCDTINNRYNERLIGVRNECSMQLH